MMPFIVVVLLLLAALGNICEAERLSEQERVALWYENGNVSWKSNKI